MVNIMIIPAGAGDFDGKIGFLNLGGSRSKIDASCSDKIDVKKIDSVVDEHKVSFIKMDIEGAELDALKGAARTIKRDKPRLAICIYHRNSDFVEIPEFIHGLVPEYRLYVRHHGRTSFRETVLYAQT